MIRKLCCAPCCTRYREEGSRWCSIHRSKYEEQERIRHEEYLSNRFNYQNKTITPERQKFYQSAKYKRLRSQFLRENPICVLCGVNEATEIHHIGEDYWNEEQFFDTDMWRGLCHSCHTKVSNERKKK